MLILVLRGSSHGVMAKVFDCGLKVNKFECQSCYYVHFQSNTLGKVIELLYPPPPAMC